jgi:hypothetical protein
MNWITIQLLKLKIREAKKRMNKESNDIVKRAYKDLIQSFESSILFLSVL